MSNARVDISSAESTRKRDISCWIEPDISKLSARGNRRYNKRKNAVQDYFTTDLPIEEITLQHHLSTEILLKLVEQCCMQHEDGTLWGYRALVPGTDVIDHSPAPNTTKESSLLLKQEDVLTGDATEEVIDGIPCPSKQASFAEGIDDRIEDEDDEDTAQRPAVKIASAIVPLASPARASLNGHGTLAAEVAVVKEEDRVLSTDVVNDLENAVEIEEPKPIENGRALKTTQVEVEREVEVEESSTKRADAEIDSEAEDEEVVVSDDVEQEEGVWEGDAH
ncbi:MAG TPA: hypothetical protein VE843_16500, partial [Ktedonobacteraceae bacterium]|nr:hypothetical protein [Ktedonobacteraceae bacterium]